MEWSRSSVGSKSVPGTHERNENAATAHMQTPKVTCRAAAGCPQVPLRRQAIHSTANPNRRNPLRATQAPSTPCAPDSLVVFASTE